MHAREHWSLCKVPSHLARALSQPSPILDMLDQVLEEEKMDGVVADVYIFVERLDGFQTLLETNRQGKHSTWFPPIDCPLGFREEWLLNKYREMVEITEEALDMTISPEVQEAAAEELLQHRRTTVLANPHYNSYCGVLAMNLTQAEIDNFNSTVLRHFEGQEGESKAMSVSKTVLETFFLPNIPKEDRMIAQKDENIAAFAKFLLTLQEHCPETPFLLDMLPNALQTDKMDLIIADVYIFVERLDGFQALVEIHRQGKHSSLFPPIGSQLGFREDWLLNKYKVMAEISEEAFQFAPGSVPEEVKQAAAEELFKHQRNNLLANPLYNSYTGALAMGLTEDEIDNFNDTILRHFLEYGM